MCGIVGYVGGREACPVLLKGLHRLEYRGYDSAGVAMVGKDGALNVYKCKGKVSDLEHFLEGKELGGSIGIAHTRWATHGVPNDVNAHPHYSESENIALIHNGIIENYRVLKDALEENGYTFRSSTDSEVLVNLIEYMQAMAAALSTPDDVILFFSYSGATKDMLDVLRPARRRGAKIILVTHFAKSPAAAMADVTLLCGSKEGPLQSGSVAAKMGLLFIIDVLFNEYCRTNPALTEANREATAGAISAKLL